GKASGSADLPEGMTAPPEQLGATRPFTPADIAALDRELGLPASTAIAAVPAVPAVPAVSVGPGGRHGS
ncbi:MAG TPA: hypothetical protein VLH10_11655, partial [Yinghuangia sp.]|nr:hypothetical protein [Yinghuangia sp.]